MLRAQRLAAIGIAAVVGLWLVAPAVGASDGGSSPVVSQSGNAFIVDLPGVGSLVFSVDPASGAISNVVVTAAASGDFTAGAPKVTEEGVEVSFTSPSGTSQVLAVKVEQDEGVVKVEAESDDQSQDHQGDQDEDKQGNQDEEHAQATSTTEESASTTEPDEQEAEQGEEHGDEQEHETPTAQPATTTTTEASEGDHNADNGADHNAETGDSSGGSGGDTSGGGSTGGGD